MGIPALGAVNQAVSNFGGAAFNEMKVDSDFINRLNNKPSTQCNWYSYNRWIPRVLWWGGYWVTDWYQKCLPANYPGFKAIPSNVVLKAVIGQDNEIDNMIGDTGTDLKGSRIAIGLLATYYAVWFAALGASGSSHGICRLSGLDNRLF